MRNRFTAIILLFCIHVSATGVKSSLDFANQQMLNKNYNLAVTYFVEALAELPKNERSSQFMFINEQLAIANLKLKNYSKSAYYFDQVIHSEARTPTALFQYAKLLMTLKQYDKAAELLTEWGTLTNNNDVAEQYKTFIDDIHNKTNEKDNLHIEKTSWSTDMYNEFCPMFHPAGGLIYTSNQPSVKNSKDNASGVYPMSLYKIDDLNGNNSTSTMSPLFSRKSGYNRGVGCLTSGGNTIYFTGNNETGIPAFSSKSPQFKLGIFVSHFDGFRWSKPQVINICDSKNNYAFPSLNSLGDTMVFSSDILGGEGGMDLYYSVSNNGVWSKPVNLGSNLNSKGDELYPNIHTLNGRSSIHFATNGRPGYGGLDVFKATNIYTDSTYVTILPMPINSSYDDFGYVSTQNNTLGYISSNREGSDDVFSIRNVSVSSRNEVVKQPAPITVIIRDTIRIVESKEEISKSDAKSTPQVEQTNKVVTEKIVVVEDKDKEPDLKKPGVKPIKEKPTKTYQPSPDSGEKGFVESQSLTGYYMVVYSVKNAGGFAKFRDTHYPDALIVRNKKTGFYHIAYYLADTQKQAKFAFNNRDKKFSKAWISRFGS